MLKNFFSLYLTVKIPENLPTKYVAVFVMIITVAFGVVGFEAGAGNIFKGSDIPASHIMGNGTTDAGDVIHLWVKFGSIPPSTPSYMWFVNGNYSTGSTLNVKFNDTGNYTVTVRISFENNKTHVTDYAKEKVNQILSASATVSTEQANLNETVYLNSTVNGGTLPYKFNLSVSGILASGYILTIYQIAKPSAQNTTLSIGNRGDFMIQFNVTDSAGNFIIHKFYIYIS